MRKNLLLLLLFSSLLSFAQNDAVFSKRLNEYMRLTRELKFDEIMDYTHPKLFKLAPKEQLAETFKQAFDNETMKIEFDSTSITGVSKDFKVANALYRKIDYWMSLTVRFKDTASLNDESFITTMTGAFQNGFPGGKVEFNKDSKTFKIEASSLMIAIKDDANTPWKFLGYQKNEALLKELYPQEVIDHFKLL